MVAATQGKLLTAEEFAELPKPTDGSRQELVRGVVVTMPSPKLPHGITCGKVSYQIGKYCAETDLGFMATNDTGVITGRGPDTVRGPDIAYWSYARLPITTEGYAEVLPDLAIEVVSPSNTRKQIDTKVAEYLRGGAKMVWVVDPANRLVSVYRTDPLRATTLHCGTTLEGEDVLPGFQCPVTALFPPLPAESD